MKTVWECFNAFKENGKVYRYGDKIGNPEYEKISDNNKKWFVKVKPEDDLIEKCPRCENDYVDILGIGYCGDCFKIVSDRYRN